MKRKVHLLALLPVAVLLFVGASCGGSDRYITKEGMVWNTTYRITYRGPESLADSITATLAQVGASMNVFDSLSTLSRINQGSTDSVDAMLARVVANAKTIHKNTGGAFDPTLGPAIRAWGFGQGHKASADTSRLDSIRQFVGFDKWNINKGKVLRSDSHVELNLSGIAKGFGCDAVAEMFRRNGVTDFMIEIGGEIAIGGCRPRGGKWNIAIDKPIVSDTVIHDFLTTVALTDCGMATSGNYRNFHMDADGNRFGHTLNPVSLRPADTDVLSATVIASTAALADGYATAMMVLGSESALNLAERQHLAVLLVTGRGVLVSSKMKSYMSQS